VRRIRVLLAGATGRTGREVARYLVGQSDLQLVAALAREGAGGDLGDLAGPELAGVPVFAGLEEAYRAAAPQVWVDFTRAAAVEENLLLGVRLGLHPVVGTSGIRPEKLRELEAEAERVGVGAAVISNFSLGAMLLAQCAVQVHRWFPDVEIIELHHATKVDRPSGTALRLAERLGGEVPIHSVRLPGLMAHQEVLFGGDGEVLTLRHDALSRSCYGPGVATAVRKVQRLRRVVYDLEELLEEERPRRGVRKG
jgi:4-hydroxy-tetrahydrodipicolinate reductase